ncbi:hypothetical protein LTR35_006262 [Friedmanniomyces endolithicus]|uniref:Uncharacterized protein n=1 Tax=Friedmanniomyces endolithicus TaxID=329885 RepID=A0AAN6FSY0_9PEZI|nr:hypothetical protein LTR35_006262 [Friedmanniomyces endolithicus]KAK0301262.1 hypothetical protein LTS00_000411 [Friedmanniomyces endolithicus]KAK0322179.1 hypothetical protein LTR82_006632 [Friedmanniomyces endolithicus]KAK1014552.1 hypothetical protein LTR54_004204 [Friedmanniomyces endolithicus]KAK1061245.1 hypothetical protein LTR74_011255 [Friedmanniomyces endolithicus]
MAYPPYQWRADGGYQTLPPPSQPLPAVPAPGIFAYLAPPWYLQPLQYVPGPLGVYGIAQPPAPPKEAAAPPAPPPPPKEEDKKPAAKKPDADKKKPPKPNPRAPPTLLPGTNYMFPMETLTLHIFKPASKIWLPKYKGRPLPFKIFYASTQKTVKQMIEYVKGAKSSEGAEKCGGWAATECIEVGDGTFLKGTTIEYGSDRAKSTFEACGWNGRRGQDLPPVSELALLNARLEVMLTIGKVWIAIHKS